MNSSVMMPTNSSTTASVTTLHSTQPTIVPTSGAGQHDAQDAPVGFLAVGPDGDGVHHQQHRQHHAGGVARRHDQAEQRHADHAQAAEQAGLGQADDEARRAPRWSRNRDRTWDGQPAGRALLGARRPACQYSVRFGTAIVNRSCGRSRSACMAPIEHSHRVAHDADIGVLGRCARQNCPRAAVVVLPRRPGPCDGVLGRMARARPAPCSPRLMAERKVSRSKTSTPSAISSWAWPRSTARAAILTSGKCAADHLRRWRGCARAPATAMTTISASADAGGAQHVEAGAVAVEHLDAEALAPARSGPDRRRSGSSRSPGRAACG